MERNKLYNMDCIAGMSMIPDGAVDMILTDLPYGITGCLWDSMLPLDQLWRQYERVIKPNGAIVLTACQPFTSTLIQSNRKRFRYCWYWHKNMATGFPFAKYQPMRCIEDIVVFYRKPPTYHQQGLIQLEKPIKKNKRKGKESGFIYGINSLSKKYTAHYTNYPKNLLEVKTERGLHPTQKPVELFEYLIRTYTNPSELVLDSCMGSGTTAVACINSNRDYIGFELDETYYNTAQNRILQSTAKEKSTRE